MFIGAGVPATKPHPRVALKRHMRPFDPPRPVGLVLIASLRGNHDPGHQVLSRISTIGISFVATLIACGPTESGMDLEARIEGRLDSLDARTSFYAKHLPTGRTIGIRADDSMNALSVSKIPIMILAFRDAEAGTFDLDETYEIKPEDLRRGSGLLQTFAPGLRPTYRDILTQMIITSDNTATDVMIARLGMDRINGSTLR